MKEFLHQLGYRTVDDAIEFLMAGEQIADEAPDDQPEQMRML